MTPTHPATGYAGAPQAPATQPFSLDAVEPYRWAIDPLQSFGSLLAIAGDLANLAPAPSDRQTGSPALNLYLVAVAMDQILSDHLHRRFYELSRPWSPPWMHGILRAASHVQHAVRRRSAGIEQRRLIRLEKEICRLTRSLGRAVIDGTPVPAQAEITAFRRLSRTGCPRSLRRSVLKIPQSFRGVDLYPDDCQALAERAMQQMDRGPVVVVGLRTSGMYMGPLCAAAFDRAGWGEVELMSLRPGVPMLPSEDQLLRRLARARGWAFIVDDPPWLGSAFELASSTMRKIGFDQDRVVIGACEIGNQPAFQQPEGELPGVWAGFKSARKVVLRKAEWTIHRRLSDESAQRLLNGPDALARLGASRVEVVRGHEFADNGEPPPIAGVPIRPRERRFHVQKLFEIELTASDGKKTAQMVLGRGVGLGVFGYHSWLCGSQVEPMIPQLLGIEDGVLYRRWDVGSSLTRETWVDSDLEKVAAYIARRAIATQHSAPVEGAAPELRSAYTASRLVARTLSRSMRRLGALAQFRAADELTRRIPPPRWTAVDARLGLDEWVRTEAGNLVKVDFEEHGADITDRRIVDPLYDVASASIGLRLNRGEQSRLLERYIADTGDTDRVRPRFAYQSLTAGLVNHEAAVAWPRAASRPRGGEALVAALDRINGRLTQAVNAYLADIYLAGVESRGSGDVWAIDLDDTLENDWYGFSATSPAGARALRVLAAHDALVIVSSGRSLADVKDRCETFAMAGGIAEYGSVAWDARNRRVIPMVGSDQLRSLELARQAIREETEYAIDEGYRYTVRAFRPAGAGRGDASAGDIRAVIARRGIPGLGVVEGNAKTVVWALPTDKSRALSPLLDSLGVDRKRRLTHVIGDSVTDLGIMRLADRRHAPANASRELRQGCRGLGLSVARRGWGAGVLAAVEAHVHTSGRSCGVCAEPVTDGSDEVLLGIMGMQDRSRLARLAYAIHPASLRAFEI